jgi:hypothetical protein
VYLVQWCPVLETGTSVCPESPTTEEFQWSPDTKGASTVSPMNPSLYELFRCQRRGDRVLRLESAFVLIVADESQAQRLRAKYEQFQMAMNRWTPAEASMLQHAYMQHLNLTENR